MVNEKPSRSNHFLKSNTQKSQKAENKKAPEFKSFSERKLKVTSKTKQK